MSLSKSFFWFHLMKEYMKENKIYKQSITENKNKIWLKF